MSFSGPVFAIRLLPIVMLVLALMLWMFDVQGKDGFVVRNTLAPFLLLALSALTLWRGHGTWGGGGKRMLFGTLGFAIPAIGLTSYLHYAYSTNLNNMFTAAEEPLRVFQFLPLYTVVAGVIGFAIGWIAGRAT